MDRLNHHQLNCLMTVHDPDTAIKLLSVENAKHNAIMCQLLKSLYKNETLSKLQFDEIIAAAEEACNEAGYTYGIDNFRQESN